MINLNAADFSSVISFATVVSNHEAKRHLCINAKVHATLEPNGCYGDFIKVLGACDGSCTAMATNVTDVFRYLLDGNSHLNRDRAFSVILDESAVLLALEASVLGRFFHRTYDTDGPAETCTYCTGTRHLVFNSHEKWVEDVYDADPCELVHSLRGPVCDGSCKAPVALDRTLVCSVLRQLRRMEQA